MGIDCRWRHLLSINDRACNVSSERIRSWPTKERPRERLLAEGPERLTDADLLAIILRNRYSEKIFPGRFLYLLTTTVAWYFLNCSTVINYDAILGKILLLC